MRKKCILLAFLILSLGLLAGFGKKTVELLNAKPLIDLSEAIQDSPYGSDEEGLALDESDAAGSDENLDGNQTSGQTSQNDTDSKEGISLLPKSVTYRITVRSSTIKYGTVICADAQELKEKIQRDYKSGDKVILRDDYAEAHAYREVLALLEELAETMDLEYGEQ